MTAFVCIGIRIPAEKMFASKITPRCSHKIPSGSKFCPSCGLGVIIEDEKKMVEGFDGKMLHGFSTMQYEESYFVAPWFLSTDKTTTRIASDMAIGEIRLQMVMKLGSLWDESTFGIHCFVG